MKRVGSVATVGMILLAAASAFAQQAANPGPPGPSYGYYHMWGGGWHPGMVLAPFVMLLALIGVVALIAWLVRCFAYGGCRHGCHHGMGPHFERGHDRAALGILEERFARGEIGKEEFEEKRNLLRR